MAKKTIIAITGKSGSGKSTLADYLERTYGIPMIRSYTTRPQRNEGDADHTFLTESEFKALPIEDILGYTKFGGYEYACLHSDVSDISSYVISEDSMVYIKEAFSDKYDIKTVRLKRDKWLRVASVGMHRVARDAGRFNLSDDYFDHVIEANTLEELYDACRKSEIIRV